MSATAAHLALPAIARFGRFEILGRLAIGGMAEIFLAREQGPGRGTRGVVLKRILPHVATDPRFIEMFVHEAELAMNLNHPNLCAIHEFGERDGEYFIAMEWVRGVSVTQLHKALFERGCSGIPAPLVARLAAQVADALDYAHAARDANGMPLKLVHRDVTPDNIMVGFDGKVKLLDFGVAKAASQRQKTATGMLKGKFAYMSPEQYGGVELDGRADLFSLGACMYEAITGMALFHRASEYETMGAIVSTDPAPRVRLTKREVSAELDGIISKALAKDRDERFQSGSEMQEALERFFLRDGLVVRAQDLAEFVGELCAHERDAGPSLDTRREIWTREMVEATQNREAMREALGQDVDAVAESFAEGSKLKRVLVRLAIATVVLGLLGLVIYRALVPE